LLDPGLFDFAGLKGQPGTLVEGDIAFDKDDFSARLIQFPSVHTPNNEYS
jgi:hypothetical protein